jgi:hypothetical protein
MEGVTMDKSNGEVRKGIKITLSMLSEGPRVRYATNFIEQLKETEAWYRRYSIGIQKCIDIGLPILVLRDSITVPLDCIDEFNRILSEC